MPLTQPLRATLDALPMPVWCADQDGVIMFLNDSLRAEIGAASDAAAGDSWLRAIHPGDREHFSSAFAALRGNGLPGHCTLRLAGTGAGQFQYRSLHLAPVADAASGSSHWQCVILPMASSHVEALKRTMEALSGESDPDRLVEHVLRTIVQQFGAHSLSVWRRDYRTDTICFEFAFEDGAVVSNADPRFAGMNMQLPMDAGQPWPAFFRQHQANLIDDIRQVPPFPLSDRLIAMGIVTVLLIPMSISGRVEGAIGIRFASQRRLGAEELELAQALANHAMLALQLTRLAEQGREAAVIQERNRMARDIHDTLAQGFTGVIVQLEAAKDAGQHGYTAEAEQHLNRAASLARDSLTEARRSVQALRPQALESADWHAALQALIKRVVDGTSLRAEFAVLGAARALPPGWDEHLLRIGQEALTNAIRHAGASQFSVTITYAAAGLRLELRDNGVGFDPHRQHTGFGLQGMEERAACIGGSMHLASGKDNGTTITIEAALGGEGGAQTGQD